MEKWMVAAKKADFDGWAQKFGISPVLARIIRNRDIVEEEEVKKYLEGRLEDCYSPWLLHDMDKAVEIIGRKLKEKAAIRVIGDYDVDGICSSYILTKGLRTLGAQADTAIPHRIHDGYGLNEHLIEEARQDGIDTIITCDNGIAASSQIQQAVDYGMTVIVTDHHEVPFVEDEKGRREILPPAQAVIDPKQEACQYPFPHICGAVVAYKLVQALVEKRKEEDGREETHTEEWKGMYAEEWKGKQTEEWKGKQTEEWKGTQAEEETAWDRLLEECLEFAALATVCDVMELRDENRILVKEGLKRLRNTSNLGIRALIEVNKIDPAKLSAYHLGFIIGPCLNATGRLDTAVRALELLESRSKAEAMSAAAELKELNDSRKNLTLEGVEQAEEYIRRLGIGNDKVMLVYLPQVHESLAGIIAGRIREKYNRPVFVLTKAEDGVKGSGRSIEAYHMYENMVAVKQYFSKFGGHKLAAGLSMAIPEGTAAEEQIEKLRRELNGNCGLTEDDFVPRVHIDVPMPLTYADKNLVRDLERLEPFGVSNPKPLFAQKGLHLIRGWRMGAKQNFARFRVRTPEGTEAELVFFGDLERFQSFLDEKYGAGSGSRIFEQNCDYEIAVTYQLGINSYRGNENLQFIVQNYC